MNTDIFSYKTFKNRSVKNADGDTLGDIYDVVIDLQTGEIVYLVLASGGFLGVGEKHLPIPYEALQYDPKQDTYYMDVPKDKFKEAPHIDLEGKSSQIDNRYVQDVYSYYGYKRKV